MWKLMWYDVEARLQKSLSMNYDNGTKVLLV